jgi:hypothetical protein
VWRAMGTRPTKAVPAVRLLTCYDDTVAAIVQEMDNTKAGDRIEFSVYVLEPGGEDRESGKTQQTPETSHRTRRAQPVCCGWTANII